MAPESRSAPSGPVKEAVILMAGEGSRLRGSDKNFLKPLVSVAGRPLVSYTINELAAAGVTKIHAVVGFGKERLIPAVEKLAPADVELRFVENRDWRKRNGISLLAAAPHVHPPFFLAMSDHLFERSMIDRLMTSADFSDLNLAIDRKLGAILDPEDAMKVRTNNGLVVELGKELGDYDAIDTGLFICPAAIFEYLQRAKHDDDCSLAEGVGLMAKDGKVRAIDIGNAWWQDVDTVEMLTEAEKRLTAAAKI